MDIQRRFVSSLLVAVTAIAGAGCGSDGGSDDPSVGGAVDAGSADSLLTENPGSTIDCARIIRGVTESAPPDFPVTVEPGWRGIPVEFQTVPPGGELCGSMSVAGGSPLVRSALFGQALADVYRPAATAAGCTLTVEFIDARPFNTRTQVEIECGNQTTHIQTDTGYDFYSMFTFGTR